MSGFLHVDQVFLLAPTISRVKMAVMILPLAIRLLCTVFPLGAIVSVDGQTNPLEPQSLAQIKAEARKTAIEARRAQKLANRIPPPLGAWKTNMSLPYDILLPEDQVEWDQAFDKLNIRTSEVMQSDRSEKMLALPNFYMTPIGFDIAKIPPKIDFAIIQNLEPAYLPKFDQREFPVWGGWGAIRIGPGGCFYYSIGNHAGFDGNAVLLRYDPSTRKQELILSTRELIGTPKGLYGDSKLHGIPDIAPNGEYWGLTLQSLPPTQEELDSHYTGSSLIHANVLKGTAESLGVPLQGDTWVNHAWDWNRGFLVAASDKGAILAYDTKNRRVHYGGLLPDQIKPSPLSLFVDRETGLFYGSDLPPEHDYYTPSKNPHPIFRYGPRNNVFTRLKVTVPANPVTGMVAPISAATARKDRDGNFWCLTTNGTLFSFNPSQETIGAVTTDWQNGFYTYDITISPSGRYLYYLPGSDTGAYLYGTPVVQYDTKTGRKKALAFLNDYYLEKYGYSPGGTYGIEIDTKGESLFFYTNGQFKDSHDRPTHYGRPAIFHLHIPEEEQREN